MLLKSHGQYFDHFILKTEFSVIHPLQKNLQRNVSDLFKYLIASNLRTALQEVIK
jgi:hypothetical protein